MVKSLFLCRQVHLLRSAGDEVTITVEYLRDAPSFLNLPSGKGPRDLRGPGGFLLPLHVHTDGAAQRGQLGAALVLCGGDA